MLTYILALAVLIGSFAVYMAAFFFPEVHRKGDFLWSGIGLFYALVLWFCAGRITGAVLLGQTASVALLGWFGWQTLALRRKVTPVAEQTLVTGDVNFTKNMSAFTGRVPNLFKGQPKDKPVPPKPTGKPVETMPQAPTTPATEIKTAAPDAIASVIPPSEATVAATAEIQPLVASGATPKPETDIKDLPSAAALSGALSASESKKDEDFEDELEPEAPPASPTPKTKGAKQQKAPQKGKQDVSPRRPAAKVKAPPVKEKVSVKPASGGGTNILAPVTGLFATMQNGIKGLLSGGKKDKSKPADKTPKPSGAIATEQLTKETDAVVEGALEETIAEAVIETAIAETLIESAVSSAIESAVAEAVIETAIAETLIESAIAEAAVEQAVESTEVREAIASAMAEQVSAEAAVDWAIAKVVVDRAISEVAVEQALSEAEEVQANAEAAIRAAEAVRESAEADRESSVTELIPPNPPNPELVAAARGTKPEEGSTAAKAAVPIEKIAPEVDLAPAAEGSESLEASPEAEPEPAPLPYPPLEKGAQVAEPAPEESRSEQKRSKRADPIVVETAKRPAEAKAPTTPPAGQSAQSSEGNEQ